MGIFRKKPVEIEARLTDGTPESNRDIIEWTRESACRAYMDKRYVGEREVACLSINTLEGTHWVTPGDWIIKGVKGEFYPCKPDIFLATYDAVSDPAAAAE